MDVVVQTEMEILKKVITKKQLIEKINRVLSNWARSASYFGDGSPKIVSICRE